MTKILIDLVTRVAIALADPRVAELPECQDAVEAAMDTDADAFADNCQALDTYRVCATYIVDGVVYPGGCHDYRDVVVCEVFTSDGVVLGTCDGRD